MTFEKDATFPFVWFFLTYGPGLQLAELNINVYLQLSVMNTSHPGLAPHLEKNEQSFRCLISVELRTSGFPQQ
jgi:hypothetical protein